MDRVQIAQQMHTAMRLVAEQQTDEATMLMLADLYVPWEVGKGYLTGKVVKYGANPTGATQLYKVLQEHTSQGDWPPDKAVSLYVRIADPAEEWPEWVQPLGAHDAYPQGAKVSHQGKHWVSEIDANTYEPGVYGWAEQQ